MKISKRPLFKELCKIIGENHIHSWKMCDFWNRVKLLNIENNNVNYQSVYRLLQYLVQEHFLESNYSKSGYAYTMYNETPLMNGFRINFCIEATSTTHRLQLKNKTFSDHLHFMLEEITAYENLKISFPELQLEIDALIRFKNNEIIKTQAQKQAIENLIIYIHDYKSKIQKN